MANLATDLGGSARHARGAPVPDFATTGRYGKLFIAVVVYFVYNNGVGIAQSLIERGELSPWIGVWPVHLAVAAAATALIFSQSAGGWRLGLRWRRYWQRS